MANAETNALVGLRKLLPKELFYNTDMDMLGAECEEIRIRAGRNVRFVLRGGEIAGSAVATPKLCRDVLEGLSEHSAPAIENELKEGFFTARGGCRVGVCGQMYTKNGLCERLWQISGFNIRIARQIKGCADKIIREVYSCGNAGGLLVLSIPGAGKTTLLRDTVRQLSDGGRGNCGRTRGNSGLLHGCANAGRGRADGRYGYVPKGGRDKKACKEHVPAAYSYR